jgi:protein-L-isoaspartate(D-aspartate) O-methyltransferase
MVGFEHLRKQMINHQLIARGLQDQLVIEAINNVRREQFVSKHLVDLAYQDGPLPIEENQTISQPYIVALMVSALELSSESHVLEVGTGSGYAAAVLSEISDQVFTIERLKVLADLARIRLTNLGYQNIHVLHGDGTLGWKEHAPFDAIMVSAGGPDIPKALKEQLKIGGRLVIPIGSSLREQSLLRITRISEEEYTEEDLGDVRFVPLIGANGWGDENTSEKKKTYDKGPLTLPELIYQSSEHFANIDKVNLNNLMDRIGDSHIVLLGESTHGTAEFYEMRARITKELIEKKGFNVIAVEADWPDSAHINNFIQGLESDPLLQTKPFSRFPTWMWANYSVMNFLDWLKNHNMNIASTHMTTSFYGLDLYNLFGSIEAVLNFLDEVDPTTAEIARVRYACLAPYADDPLEYSRVNITKEFMGCEKEVIEILINLLKHRLDYSSMGRDKFFNAERNAYLVRNTEQYYRTMYYAESNSWNQRDSHMFETLKSILAFKGNDSRAVIWAHNSHIGDARATQMSTRGELNLGQLAREEYGERAYLIGFGTDHGTVAAASSWGGPMEIKEVQASHLDSYERVFHEVKTDNFLLPLREPIKKITRDKLLSEKLQRAIGVIYRPETERQSHYFQASLPDQFDEYIWFDETHAIDPLPKKKCDGMPFTFPFGL